MRIPHSEIFELYSFCIGYSMSNKKLLLHTGPASPQLPSVH